LLGDAEVSGWCERSLGSPVARVLFRSGHLSEVIGVEFAGGGSAVVKVRPAEPRIAACTAVQASLAAAGFPCPAPLAGPETVNGLAVTAETYVPGGELLSPERGAAPSPPWTGWDHQGGGLWPDRDDEGQDLNRSPGPAWVDRAADLVRRYLRTCREPPRIGHGDWESQNQQAWAAGLWVCLFDAKKEAVSSGGPQLDLLAAEISGRLDLAGLPRA
jgi:hypothetical protein